MERAEALIDAECDLLVVDTAHGHSARVFESVAEIKKKKVGDWVEIRILSV